MFVLNSTLPNFQGNPSLATNTRNRLVSAHLCNPLKDLGVPMYNPRGVVFPTRFTDRRVPDQLMKYFFLNPLPPLLGVRYISRCSTESRTVMERHLDTVQPTPTAKPIQFRHCATCCCLEKTRQVATVKPWRPPTPPQETPPPLPRVPRIVLPRIVLPALPQPTEQDDLPDDLESEDDDSSDPRDPDYQVDLESEDDDAISISSEEAVVISPPTLRPRARTIRQEDRSGPRLISRRLLDTSDEEYEPIPIPPSLDTPRPDDRVPGSLTDPAPGPSRNRPRTVDPVPGPSTQEDLFPRQDSLAPGSIPQLKPGKREPVSNGDCGQLPPERPTIAPDPGRPEDQHLAQWPLTDVRPDRPHPLPRMRLWSGRRLTSEEECEPPQVSKRTGSPPMHDKERLEDQGPIIRTSTAPLPPLKLRLGSVRQHASDEENESPEVPKRPRPSLGPETERLEVQDPIVGTSTGRQPPLKLRLGIQKRHCKPSKRSSSSPVLDREGVYQNPVPGSSTCRSKTTPPPLRLRLISGRQLISDSSDDECNPRWSVLDRARPEDVNAVPGSSTCRQITLPQLQQKLMSGKQAIFDSDSSEDEDECNPRPTKRPTPDRNSSDYQGTSSVAIEDEDTIPFEVFIKRFKARNMED